MRNIINKFQLSKLAHPEREREKNWRINLITARNNKKSQLFLRHIELHKEPLDWIEACDPVELDIYEIATLATRYTSDSHEIRCPCPVRKVKN